MTSRRLVLLLLVLAAPAASASAQYATASHEVTVRVGTVDAVTVGQGVLDLAIEGVEGSDESLTLRTASATSSYSVQTNGEGRKLTAHLDDDLPRGLRLDAEVSLGGERRALSLGTQPKTFFEGITRAQHDDQTIRYTLRATLDAGAFVGTRLVTYTLTQR